MKLFSYEALYRLLKSIGVIPDVEKLPEHIEPITGFESQTMLLLMHLLITIILVSNMLVAIILRKKQYKYVDDEITYCKEHGLRARVTPEDRIMLRSENKYNTIFMLPAKLFVVLAGVMIGFDIIAYSYTSDFATHRPELFSFVLYLCKTITIIATAYSIGYVGYKTYKEFDKANIIKSIMPVINCLTVWSNCVTSFLLLDLLSNTKYGYIGNGLYDFTALAIFSSTDTIRREVSGAYHAFWIVPIVCIIVRLMLIYVNRNNTDNIECDEADESEITSEG